MRTVHSLSETAFSLSDSTGRYIQLIDSLIGQAPAASAATPDLFQHVRRVHCQLLVYRQLIDAGARPEVAALDQSCWSWLIQFVAGHRFGELEWIGTAEAALDAVVRQQQSDGQFIAANPSMNPESRWYEELITLHAIANFAVEFPTPARCRAVERAARYHLEQTQPDHATAEPWGLLAFIQYAPPLADQVLHAMNMQYVNGLTAIPLLLLRDVRYGLAQLTKQNGSPT